MKEVKIILDDNKELKFPIDGYEIDDKFIHLYYTDKGDKSYNYVMIVLSKIKSFVLRESKV